MSVYISFHTAHYAIFAETSMLMTQNDFLPSCNLMELDVTGNTTITDSNNTSTVTLDGVVYTYREISISMDFLSGIFMNIEQKPEYTG